MNWKLISLMSTNTRPTAGIVLAGLLIALAPSGLPSKAEAADALPDNAIAGRYEGGWECMAGFQRTVDRCARVVVPANAYLDASGDRWRCDRGYVRTNSKCTVVKVPQNAYLDNSFGSGWRCDRGYREARDQCVAIKIPSNAHVVDSSYGQGWECHRSKRVFLSTYRRMRSCRAPDAAGNVNEAFAASNPPALPYESRQMLIWTTPATIGSATGDFMSTTLAASEIDARKRFL
jgi:hypothetical protein